MEQDQLATLIHQAQRRSSGALDALVDAYGARLYGYLYRLCGVHEEAEDLLQEVFVRVVRTLPDYEHDGKFDGWIFRIATNLVRDRVRRIRRRPSTSPLEADPSNSREDGGGQIDLADHHGLVPGAGVAQDEEMDALQIAIAKLPEAEREVVVLRHFSGLSFARIAELMDTPLGTALARAHRGLGKLREMMEEYE